MIDIPQRLSVVILGLVHISRQVSSASVTKNLKKVVNYRYGN